MADLSALTDFLNQSLEGEFLHPSRSGTIPRFSGDVESDAALAWVGNTIYRWIRHWRGRQHVAVTEVKRWWPEGRREGEVAILVGHSGRACPSDCGRLSS